MNGHLSVYVRENLDVLLPWVVLPLAVNLFRQGLVQTTEPVHFHTHLPPGSILLSVAKAQGPGYKILRLHSWQFQGAAIWHLLPVMSFALSGLQGPAVKMHTDIPR